MFGANGTLDVDTNDAGGVRAVLVLPFDRAHAQADGR
jgi:hypothetical protein